MKKYIKPEILEKIISADTSIADGGLGDWLYQATEGGTYENTITTYQFNS